MSRDRQSEISEEFKRAGLSLGPDELKKLTLIDRVLIEKNEELDLTRIDSKSSIIKKHYLDSAMLSEFILEDRGLFMDLGSG
ncbi:MAG: 16S rRNA (guanine(527)-N(7))-methyltransferase RsmG, partial [Deltaproteobacteria bacterium]|nr:16S rRNA (guanine(527)-N(7))-methyltransferase RsmG [Deltaproteobacteria bacterium]